MGPSYRIAQNLKSCLFTIQEKTTSELVYFVGEMNAISVYTQGDGTRSGTGLCSCHDGYKGSMCDECTDGYYQQATGNIKLCNSKYKTISLLYIPLIHKDSFQLSR